MTVEKACGLVIMEMEWQGVKIANMTYWPINEYMEQWYRLCARDNFASMDKNDNRDVAALRIKELLEYDTTTGR